MIELEQDIAQIEGCGSRENSEGLEPPALGDSDGNLWNSGEANKVGESVPRQVDGGSIAPNDDKLFEGFLVREEYCGEVLVAIDDRECFKAKRASTEHDTCDGGVGMQVESLQLCAECEGSADSIVQCGDLFGIDHRVYDGEFENGAGYLFWVCDHCFARGRELESRMKRRNDPVEMCQRCSVP